MTLFPIRVLLIDDDESDFLMTQALLGQIEGQSTSIEWVSNFDDGLRILAERRHDVCLLDYLLGERTGVELLRLARSQAVRTPIVLLTGKGNRAVDLEAMKSGAVDYLEKGNHTPAMMERALRYAVERHRAQEALRQSEERHRGMFDHLPLGLFRVTEEGEYIEANPSLIRTLDFPDRDGIGQIARNFFVSPRDRESFFRTLSENGIALGLETELRTVTGRLISVRVTARAHRGPAGSIEYIEGSVEEFSPSRKDHASARDAAAFRAIMTADREGILLVAADGRILESNARAGSLLGGESLNAEGGVLWDRFLATDNLTIATALEEVAGGRAASLTCTAYPALGGNPVRATFLPLVGGPGGEEEEVVVLLLEGASASSGG